MKIAKISCLGMMIFFMVSVVHADFTATGTYSPSIWNSTNWANGEINGIIANGTNGATTVSVGSASYQAGSNVIYTGTYNARQLTVGTFISGAGIPDGAYITGIDNAGRVTISAQTTVASSGPLTVIGLGKSNGYGTVKYNPVAASYISGSDQSVYTANGVDYQLSATTGILIISGTTFDGLGARLSQNLRQNTYWTNGQGMNIVTIISATEALVEYPGKPGNNMSFTNQGVEFTGMAWLFDVSGTGVINGDLVYRNTDPWAAKMAVPNSGSASRITFAAQPSGTVRLIMNTNRAGGDIGFDYGDSGRAVVTDFSGQAVVFQIGPQEINSQMDYFKFYSTGTNLTSLTKTGVGELYLSGGATQILTLSGGAVTINEGVIRVATSNFNMTGARIVGATRYDIGQAGNTANNTSKKTAGLLIDLSSVNGAQSGTVNLIESSAAINLYAGALAYNVNGASALTSQQLGDVTARAGRVGIGVIGGNNFTLTLNSLTRENNATVNILGAATANTITLKVTNDSNILGDLVGTVSGSGATNLKILPWATGRTTYTVNSANLANAGNNFAANGLVTYTHDGGFRMLDTSEYAATVSAANADDNVRLTTNDGLGLMASATVNSLTGVSSTLAMGTSSTLTVSSGVIMRTGGNFSINSGGVITSGNRPLILYSDGGDFTIASVLTNSVTGTNAGLIAASGVGRTFLSGANTYGGATIVQSTLNLQNDKAIPVTSAMRIDAGGTLLIDGVARNVGAASLAGRGFMPFNNTASRFVLGGADSDRASELAGYITVRDGAFIAPGDADGLCQAGELTLGANILGVRFKTGSIFDIDLASDTVSDILAIGMENVSAPKLMLDDGAIIRLNFLDNYTPGADADWLLTTGFATVSGDLDNVLLQGSNGLALSDEWSLSNVSGNLLLTYTAQIPEPGTWALLLTGAGLLAFLRRRR